MAKNENDFCDLYSKINVLDEITGRFYGFYYNFYVDFKKPNPRVLIRVLEPRFSDDCAEINYEDEIESYAMAGGLIAGEVSDKLTKKEFNFLRLHIDSKEKFELICDQWVKDRQTRLKAEITNRNLPLKFL